MDEPLEELKRQRELIRRHLEWLDRRIAEADSEQASTPRESADDEPVSSPVASSIPATPPPAAEAASLESEPASFAHDPVLQEALRAERVQRDDGLLSGLSDVDRAKYGCFILFAVGIGIFLFLLFGLPALMD